MQILAKYYNENLPIQQSLVENWINEKKISPMSYGINQEEIETRIGYIISCIWQPFNVELNEWTYENADFIEQYVYDDSDPQNIIYGEDYYPDGFFTGENFISYNTTFFYLHIAREIKKPTTIKYNGIYSSSFPIQWLYSDFKEELEKEVQNWYSTNPKKLSQLKKIQKQKLEKQNDKNEMIKIQKQILSKLTDEEKRYIRFI